MILIDNKPINHYWTVGDVTNITPFGNGHINDTYLVDAENGRFILQRINKNVFLTDALVNNYELHVRAVIRYQYENNCKITPLILQTKEKKYHLIDNENYAWRLVEFIPFAKSFNISPDPKMSSQAAQAFGKYQMFLNTLKSSAIKETIKGFHDLPGRFRTFKKIIKVADNQLLLNANKEIKQLMSLSRIVEENAKLQVSLPTRIIHNDTKLNNVLFEGSNVLVIDLDTVMPGKLMFDFGDMVRSYTSPVAEDEPDIEKTILRIDHFHAIVRAYLGVLKGKIFKAEKSSLLSGARYIIYEQSIRFLNDYLQGNIYYKTNYPDHNLVRTRTQLKLLQSLISQESELKKIINLFA